MCILQLCIFLIKSFIPKYIIMGNNIIFYCLFSFISTFPTLSWPTKAFIYSLTSLGALVQPATLPRMWPKWCSNLAMPPLVTFPTKLAFDFQPVILNCITKAPCGINITRHFRSSIGKRKIHNRRLNTYKYEQDIKTC